MAIILLNYIYNCNFTSYSMNIIYNGRLEKKTMKKHPLSIIVFAMIGSIFLSLNAFGDRMQPKEIEPNIVDGLKMYIIHRPLLVLLIIIGLILISWIIWLAIKMNRLDSPYNPYFQSLHDNDSIEYDDDIDFFDDD